jgi:hypothetical protein
MTGTIIDRIAIVVGNAMIKDSDIEHDIRITDFLNAKPLSLTDATRREAANRLLDQSFIRREIRSGDYPTASMKEADQQLAKLEQQRFKSHAALENTLQSYSLTELDLRTHFEWQLTVLLFVNQRFKPAAFVSDQEVQAYFAQHETELRRQFPAKTSLDDLRADITELIAGEKTNQLFFAWLDDQRKQSKIQYHEQNLQ